MLSETRPTASWKSFDIVGSPLSVFGLFTLVFGILLLKKSAKLVMVPVLIAG